LAFPTLGTGALNFPVPDSAKQMFKCITKHAQAHPSSGIREITIVVWSGDSGCRQAKQVSNPLVNN